MPDDIQAIYDELNRRGVWQQSPDLQAIGHELRRRGAAVDPTQGGLMTTPGAAPIGAGLSSVKGMYPDFTDRLNKLMAAVKAQGGSLTATDTFRTRAQQEDLMRRKPTLAAKPGRSMHEFGLAADLAGNLDIAHKLAPQFGLVFPMLDRNAAKYEPWHIQHGDAMQLRARLGGPPAQGMGDVKAAQYANIPAPVPQIAPQTDPKEVQKQYLKFLATPNNSIPQKVAIRLASVPSEQREYDPQLQKMNPNTQAAILRKAHELAANPASDPQVADYKNRFLVSQRMQGPSLPHNPETGEPANAPAKIAARLLNMEPEERANDPQLKRLSSVGQRAILDRVQELDTPPIQELRRGNVSALMNVLPVSVQRQIANMKPGGWKQAAEVASGLGSFENLAMMAGMPQGAAGKLIGAGFAGQMFAGIPEALEKGEFVKAGLLAGLGGMATGHAMSEVPLAPKVVERPGIPPKEVAVPEAPKPAEAPTFKAGQEVTHAGEPATITHVNADGTVDIEKANEERSYNVKPSRVQVVQKAPLQAPPTVPTATETRPTLENVPEPVKPVETPQKITVPSLETNAGIEELIRRQQAGDKEAMRDAIISRAVSGDVSPNENIGGVRAASTPPDRRPWHKIVLDNVEAGKIAPDVAKRLFAAMSGEDMGGRKLDYTVFNDLIDKNHQSAVLSGRWTARQGEVNATQTRQIEEGGLGEHPGVPPGTNVPENRAEVRQAEGGQTSGGRGAVRGAQVPAAPQEVAPAPEPAPAPETPVRGAGEVTEASQEIASPEDQAANEQLWGTVKKGDLLTEPGSSQRLRVQAKSTTRIKVVDEAKPDAPSFTISRKEFREDYNLNVRPENEPAEPAVTPRKDALTVIEENRAARPYLYDAKGKPLPSDATGLTKPQKEYLNTELEKAKTPGEGPVVIQVPGDGRFTVQGPVQAEALQKAVAQTRFEPQQIPFQRSAAPKIESLYQADAPTAARLYGGVDKALEAVEKRIKAIRYEGSTVEAVHLGALRHTLSEMVKTSPKGTALQASLIPGLPEYLEQDVIPTVRSAPQAAMSIARNIRDWLSPASASPEAGKTANIIRENAAELARKTALTQEALKQAQTSFRNVLMDRNPIVNGAVDTNHPALKFIDAIETGNAQGLPAPLNAVADSLRKALDERVAQVQKLGRLQNVIEDYFPHIWKDPQKAEGFLQSYYGKRPMEGGKAFLKQRTIPTTMEGIAKGLEPVTFNPIDLALLKIREMDRWIFAHKAFEEMKGQGIAKYVSTFGDRPEGYVPLDDRIAQVTQIRPTTKVGGEEGAPEMILRGHWYAPEPAARVFNNYLSPGLRGQPLYDAVSAAGNTMNQAQLGLSGFHLTFTTLDAMISKVALGLEQLSRGQIGRGTGNVVKGVTPYAPIENIIRGNKVLTEYLNPGKIGGETAAIVDALQAGGGRVRMDPFYKNSAVESFWNALEKHNYPGAILRAPMAIVEQTAKPLMEYIVPRQKLGVFADMAKMELERLGPNPSREAMREAMGKAWDSVDNRMGQLVYDNLFWQKTLKDMGLIMTRSLGWNLGTIRELGGAGVDMATLLRRAKAGQPAVTHRIAYAAALPATVALYGAVMTYLYTGKGPQSLLDYFQPPTGQKDKSGQPERVQLPTYMRDIVPDVRAAQRGFQPFVNRLYEQASGKRHPLIDMTSEMVGNKDFFGTDIRNENDPFVAQAKQEAAYMAKQFLPYSFRQPPSRAEETASQKVQRFFGVTPAPRDISEGDKLYAEAMRKLMEAKQKGATPRPRYSPGRQKAGSFGSGISKSPF